ncbi:MAG: putative hydrolase of the superfamily [Ilumatobacteraceae bacterium]|jgi:epoxide hydrolase-like predicted phosphatase
MRSHPYSAVVFDFGGVLISPITDRISEVAVRHGVTMEELLHVLMGPPDVSTEDHPWHRAERGEIAVHGFQELVQPWADEVGIALTGDEFEIILDGVFRVHDDIVKRIVGLRSEGITTALLTNSFKEFRAHIEKHVDFSIFDLVIDSSEVGHRKPEPEIYALTTKLLGVAPERILYLDDFLANVVGAREAGWHAIHVTGPQQALAALADALA